MTLRGWPLQLPRREATDMQMELIQPGHRTLSPDELNLEFQLVLRDGPRTHCAGFPSAHPAPHAIRVARRHSGGSRLFSETRFVVRHLLISNRPALWARQASVKELPAPNGCRENITN